MPTLIQLIDNPGYIMYVILWNAVSQVWNNTTQAWETLDTTKWAQYAILATEQSTASGSYFATVPSAIIPGTYTFASYKRNGSVPTPPPVDSPRYQNNIVVPSPTAAPPQTMPQLIQIIDATGNQMYAFLWNSISQVWNNVTKAFETLTDAHWTQYAVPAVEQSTNSGSYIVTIPIQITTPGNYTWGAYLRTGGTPTPPPTDIPRNAGPFVILPTQSNPPVPASLAGLITQLRILCQDYADSKLVRGEQLGQASDYAYPVNGSNQTFMLKKAPMSDIIGSPVYTWVTIVGAGGTVRTQTGFTISDPINGIISFAVAPNPGSNPNGIWVDYNYEWFTDAKYAEFLYQAAQMTLAGTTDPTTIVNGLQPAMFQFALSQFWKARASQYAEEYRSAGGEASEDVQTVAQTYLSLGKDAYKQAMDQQLNYYKGQGQREKAAFGDIIHLWDPITPIR